MPAIRKRGRIEEPDNVTARKAKVASRKDPVFRAGVRKVSAKSICSGRLQLRFRVSVCFVCFESVSSLFDVISKSELTYSSVCFY